LLRGSRLDMVQPQSAKRQPAI